MLNQEERASKSSANAPRIALCLGIVGVLYVIYVIGATTHAVRKYESDTSSKGSYGAAMADHEASSASGPMTDEQKQQFISEAKKSRQEAAKRDIDDAMQPRHALEFNTQLQGVWRSIPQGQEASREFLAGLFRDEFMVESEHLTAAQATQQRLPGKQVWSNQAFKIRAAPASDRLEITREFTRVTLEILPCRKIVSGHFFKDCMTMKDGYRLIEVSYRDRDLTDAEQTDLQASKGRVARDLFNQGENQIFR